MTDDPRLSMLIKLLKLTQSDNDAEALLAARKANSLLASHFNGDWEALLRGKIKLIADPFLNLAEPRVTHNEARGYRPAKPKRFNVDHLA